jgi:hypothetical protein
MLSTVSHSDFTTFLSRDLKKRAAEQLAFKIAHAKLEEDYPDLKPFATYEMVRGCVFPMSDFLETIDDWLDLEKDDPRREVINYAQAWYKWERDGLLGEGEVPFIAIQLKSVWQPDENDAANDKHVWGLMEGDFEPDHLKWPFANYAYGNNEQWLIRFRDLIDLLTDEKRLWDASPAQGEKKASD